jgi:hypothetical protein
MKTSLKIFLVLLIIFPVLPSCTKRYPDGPLLNVTPRKERMANTWYISSYYENGVDKTTDFKNTFVNARLTIYKQGNYNLYYRPLNLTEYIEDGTWVFSNSDKDFITTPTSGNGSVGTHHILRLKEKELWYYDDPDANGIKREYHLKP